MFAPVPKTPHPLTPQLVPQSRPKPYIKIIEQPSKSVRFRYECEGRPGTLAGASSTPEHKIPFAIRVMGYQGRAAVVVSCVTKDEPYKPHPYTLVGQNCKKGVCTFTTNITADTTISFTKQAVQCVKKRDLKKSLKEREQDNIDPFRTGFKHRDDVKSMDLSAVRLCFQVVIEGEVPGQFSVVLNPVVSDPIYNRRTIPEPQIHRLSHCNCYADGGKPDIILLCTRVIKEDIKVRFFETKDGQVVWEGFGDFKPSEVYNQTAICFKPPSYHTPEITNPVEVFIQLQRPSDGAHSKALPFEFLPTDAKPGALKRKREKYNDSNEFFAQLLRSPIDKVPYLAGRDDAQGPSTMTWPEPFANLHLEGNIQTTPLQDNWNVTNNLNLPLKTTMGTGGPLPALQWPQQQPLDIFPLIDSLASPSTSQTMQQNWNITNDLCEGASENWETVEGMNRLLDLDNHQLELQPIHLNSGDLEMSDVNRLSETFQENLSLSDLLV
jgi:c-Rel proto-oncogene protein